MPAVTTAPNNATDSNCLDAEYQNVMYRPNDLHEKEILVSSNCHYILIRDPATKLTLYSTSSTPQNPILSSWDLTENQNIWNSHPPFTFSDTIELSDNGCLLFSSKSNPSSQVPYCLQDTSSHTDNTDIDLLDPSLGDNGNDIPFPFDLSSTSFPSNDQYELFSGNILEDIKHVEIWVPIALCILGISCALIFLIVYFIFRRTSNYGYDPDFNTNKEPTDSIESFTDDEVHDDTQWNEPNLHVNPDMISVDDLEEQGMGYYDHNTPGGGNRLIQDYNADTEQDNDDGSGSDIDLSDCRPISDDCFVAQRIISIRTPNIRRGGSLMISTSDDYDPEIQSPNIIPRENSNDQRLGMQTNTGLTVPNKLLQRMSGGSSSSSGSELEMSSDYIQKQISNSGGSSLIGRRMGSKLAVIHDQDEIEFVRDRSINDNDEEDESSDNPQHMI